MVDIMRKFTCFFLILLLILAFSACTAAGGETESATGVATDTETETEPPTLTFSENGACEFYIVYPEEFDASIKDIAASLREEIARYTGAKLKLVSDRLSDKPSGDYGVEHTYEILLGTAGREASQRITSTMRSRDYAVSFEGTKILLAGLNPDAVEKACRRFVDDVLVKQGRYDKGHATVVMTEKDHYFYTYSKYSVDSCTILGADLGEYTIVYGDGDLYSAERYARLFRYEMSRSAGYELTLDDDRVGDGNGAREIVFGTTAHGGEDVTEAHGFSVRATGTKLYVAAECMEGYAALYEYLTQTLFLGDVNIAEGFRHTGAATTDAAARAGEYRVIFNNVHGAHVDEYPIAARNGMQAELHAEYAPDVIGLQENSADVASYLAEMKRLGYTAVLTKPTNSNGQDYTALLYRADRLTLVDCGYYLYNDGAGDKSKSISWGVFCHEASGDTFAVCSTHFYWTSDAMGKAARVKDAEQLAKMVSTLAAQYGCPVIAGGDLNCTLGSEPLEILAAAGLEHLQKISPETANITTRHSYSPYDATLRLYLEKPTLTKPYSDAIDHALLYNRSTLTPKAFRVLTNDYTLLSSDHCPILVDFDIADR